MDKEGARKCLRADCLIIATAATHGADILYSDDQDFRKRASKIGRLTVKGFPDIAPDLFEQGGMKKRRHSACTRGRHGSSRVL
jgi:hypothetical protein